MKMLLARACEGLVENGASNRGATQCVAIFAIQCEADEFHVVLGIQID